MQTIPFPIRPLLLACACWHGAVAASGAPSAAGRLFALFPLALSVVSDALCKW